ncbi:MAG: hypothetical protein HY303_08110 [Candidatus Wallbacteria bacterium]|nr:hypothetical protein [Candidatus Wallbacteria bacterium]
MTAWARVPWRPTIRLFLNAAVALYLVVIGVQGLASYLDDPPTSGDQGLGLAIYGTPAGRPVPPAQPRAAVSPAYGLQELKQTHKILGIICRDDRDRSVFVRNLESGDERIYRVGDALNGALVTEIHPSNVVLQKAGSRIVLSLFSQDREPLAEEE